MLYLKTPNIVKGQDPKRTVMPEEENEEEGRM